MDAAALRVWLEAMLGLWWLAYAGAGALFATMAMTRILEWRELGVIGVRVPFGPPRALDGLVVALVMLGLQFLFDRMFDLAAIERSVRLVVDGTAPALPQTLGGGMLVLTQVCDAGGTVCRQMTSLGPIQSVLRFGVLMAAGFAVLPVPFIDRSIQTVGLIFGGAALFLGVMIQDQGLGRIAASLALLQGAG